MLTPLLSACLRVIVQHPNIVRLFEVYEFEPRQYAMIMELASGGEVRRASCVPPAGLTTPFLAPDYPPKHSLLLTRAVGATACDHGPIIQLFDRIQAKGSFSETEAQAVMRKLLGALAYMHKKRIAHRDLKPENIMYKSATTDSEPALTDFGFAKKAQPIEEDVPQGGAAPPPGALKTRLGSPNYVAPEILTSKTGYDTAVDIWSVGVILYILLCGYFPFFHESERELYRQIKSGKYDMPDEEWRHVSNNAKDLVRKMLTLDPKKRITAHNALRHPWLRGKASGEVFPEEQLKAFADMQKIRKRSFKQAGKAVAAALRTAKAGGQGGGNANVGDVAVLATQKARRAAAANQAGAAYPAASMAFADEITSEEVRRPEPKAAGDAGGAATKGKSAMHEANAGGNSTPEPGCNPASCVTM